MDNKDFSSIMQEITSGLTGDTRLDFAYLKNQMDNYKDHELSTEIVRACGRLLFEIMPDDARQKLSQSMDNDRKGIEATLEEVRFNCFNGNYNNALNIIEALVHRIESANLFKDDQLSEYHSFGEAFEDILFRFLYKPEKEVRTATINIAEVFLTYGAILVELQRYDEAKTALDTARKWNPVRAQIVFEYLDILKCTNRQVAELIGIEKTCADSSI